MRATRGILIAVGVLGLVLGVVVLLLKQDPMQIVGVGLWLLAAIVLHDGILSPLVSGTAPAAPRPRDRSKAARERPAAYRANRIAPSTGKRQHARSRNGRPHCVCCCFG